jgi:hypothetical protein
VPYYHATRRHLLESIIRYGLGGLVVERNFPESEPGVYLSDEPLLAVGMLIDKFLDVADPASNPSRELESWVVIVIDDARVNPRRLRPDPQMDALDGFWLYDGIIDVTNAVVIAVMDLPSPG